jgi:type IV pilus assembly protein PilB
MSQPYYGGMSGTKTTKKKRLGDVLVQDGRLTQADLNFAVSLQQERVTRLGDLLLKEGLVSKIDIARALEQVQGFVYAPCPPVSIEPVALSKVSRAIAERCCAIPLQISGRELIVAMAEPQNLEFTHELQFSSGMTIVPRFSFRQDIEEAILQFYGHGPKPSKDSDDEHVTAEADSFPSLEFIVKDATEENRAAQQEKQAGVRLKTPAVRHVSRMLAEAAEKGASDIHIEPQDDSVLVRIRVDGVLRELTSLALEHRAAIVSRIKILANIDIAERRIPQDGRFLMRYKGQRLDLRVSTLPTHFGEKVVIRLLDPRSTVLAFDQLGLSPQHSSELARILALPQGMLLVTGPTGAGKSTTLYSALNLLRAPDRNIITVEDPVEYIMDGINQVQVRPKSGLTFSSVLPSLLRQDPDVIMIGEIRDVDTAEIAMKASQTGQLVLSTLHTNDSIGAISRLVNLGVPPYLIASSLTGVIAQRLVRKLCSCRREARNPATQKQILTAMGLPSHESFPQYEPVGCASCDQTGFRGRIGMYELLSIDGLIRDAVFAGSRSEEICDLARRSGFRTLHEDALEKVKKGLTTLQEIRREVPAGSTKSNRCPSCDREVSPTSRYCSYCGTMQNTRPMFDDSPTNGWSKLTQV